MIKKLLIGFSCLIVVNACNAATGHGYKILNEETHSSPGFNAHFEEVSPGTAAAQKKSFRSGQVQTHVPPKVGKVNQNITVDGYHDFRIVNHTSQKQVYETYISLECGNMNASHKIYVEVNPGGDFSRSDHSYGTVQEAYPGNYKIDAETKFSGESSAQSRSGSALTVTR